MAESTLSLGYPDFCTEVGYFLGYGRDTVSAPTVWSAGQVTEIDALVQAGYRQFLSPPIPYTWSFLYPLATLTLAASDYDKTLTDDFGGEITKMWFSTTDNQLGPVTIVPLHFILSRRESATSTGKPLYAACIPVAATAGSTGQRWQLLFWPTPDAAYVLNYRYKALVSKLTSAAPYPLGGQAHVQTVEASCLAVAEERMNDERGIKHQRWTELLAASIDADKRASTPDFFGYNADRECRGTRYKGVPTRVLLNGV